jgi:hypothetical protein
MSRGRPTTKRALLALPTAAIATLAFAGTASHRYRAGVHERTWVAACPGGSLGIAALRGASW